MLLKEVTSKEQHTATVEIWSRGSSRKGSWSTKRVRERFKELGYDIKGKDPAKPDNQMFQVVTITGTRDEIVKAKTDIQRTLRGIAGCRVPTKFALTE